VPQLGSAGEPTLALGPWEFGSLWGCPINESEEYSQLWYLWPPNSNSKETHKTLFLLFLFKWRDTWSSAACPSPEKKHLTCPWPSQCTFTLTNGHRVCLHTFPVCRPHVYNSFEKWLKEYLLCTFAMELQECYWRGTDLPFTECALGLHLELGTGCGVPMFHPGGRQLVHYSFFFFLFI